MEKMLIFQKRSKNKQMKLVYLLSLFLFFLLPNQTAHAQFASKLTIGIKGGINYTLATPTKRFDVLTSTNSDYKKDYLLFDKNMASQYAFLWFYSFNKSLSIGSQVQISTYRYLFENTYNWSDVSNYSVTYTFDQRHQYLQFPLLFKYTILHKRIRPYIQIGGFYGLRYSSFVTAETIETETGFETTSEPTSKLFSNNEQFLYSNVGATSGIGIVYTFKRSRIGIESNFFYGLKNIADKQNRMNDQQLSGEFYSITDNLLLMHGSISLVYSVSLKCLRRYIPPRYRRLDE